MGFFGGNKDKYKIIEKNGRKFLTKNGQRAGSLPGVAERIEPTAVEPKKATKFSSQEIEKPEDVRFYKLLSDAGIMPQRSKAIAPEGNASGFLDSTNFRDCDPDAILRNIDLLRIAQTADPEANLTVTQSGVEIKVGNAEYNGNQDYRVTINLNHLDLFTVQRVLVEDGKYILKGIVPNAHVSEVGLSAKDASMYKSNPFWGV